MTSLAFDPFDPEVRRDPHAAYGAMREAGPVWYHERAGLWFLTGHAEARAMLRDERFSAREGQTVRRRADALPPSMLTSDPPDHARLRRTVAPALAPAAVESVSRCAAAEVRARVGSWRAGAPIDGVSGLAAPVAAAALAALFGVDPAERERFAAWAAAVAPHFDPLDPPEPGSPPDEALDALLDWFAEQLERRRGRAAGDLLTALAHAFERGEISAGEALSTASLVVIGGYEPLADLLAAATWRALLQPGGVTPAATLLEEVLRWDAPIHFAARVAVEGAELGGRAIPAGQAVVAVLGAANRDPRVFEDPERFDPRRTPNRHLAFGGGPHGCPGAGLARAVTTTALGELAREVPTLRLAGEAAWRDRLVPRGLATLPLAIGAP